MKREFAVILRRLRMEKELTQTQLSKLVGVNKSIISAYENQERLPSLNVLIKLSAEFGVTIEQLLGLDSTPLPSRKMIDVSNLTTRQIDAVDEIVKQFSESNKLLTEQ